MKGQGSFNYLDIKIIGGQDELEESPLIHLDNTIMYNNYLFFAKCMLDQVFKAEPQLP